MDYIDQHNYAYILKRHRTVHVANYHAKVIFHLELPKRQVEFSEPIRNCANETSRTLSCIQLREPLDSVSDVRSYIQMHIQELMRRIYEILTDLPSNTRHTRRGFFTDMLSHVTGLASKHQLRALIHVLRQVETGICESARLWGDGARSLTATFKSNNTECTFLTF